MKTIDGWIRGKLCGKPAEDFSRGYICAMCGRAGERADLCFPVRR